MVSRMPQTPDSPELAVHWSGRREPDAPTLVLLHGLTDSGRCWPDAVRRWEKDYRIAALDALGHGSSPRYTAQQLADDPIELMYDATVAAVRAISGEGANRVVVIGHSMGGGIGAALAAREPGLVRAAVLEDPAWFTDVDWLDRADSAAERVEDCRTFQVDFEAAMAKGRAENTGWPPAELEPWGRAKADCDLAFLATGLAFLDTPWSAIASALKVPTLVVTGTDEVIIYPPTREAIAGLGNDLIEVAVVPGTGHCVRRDDPEGYHAVVDRWIARQVAAG